MKVHLIVKGYTQVYGIGYSKTFSPIAKITHVHLLIPLAATHNWTLHHLEVKNAFLRRDLEEEAYMEQPLEFVAQGESSRLVCKEIFIQLKTIS